MRTLAAGLLAGFGATFPMSGAMIILHRFLPWPERYRLPPKKVTMRLAERVGLKRHMEEPERGAATIASHFAYGTAAGAAFAPLAKHLPLSPVLGGIAFGLLIWAASYLGWLPAAGVLPSATKDSARRNAVMVTAHLIWGGSAGLLLSWLDPPDRTA